MGGLALGNFIASRFGDRLQRPILAYGLVEVAIGLTGLLLTLALPHLPGVLAPLFRSLQHTAWLINPLRLFLSFALLVIPTTAMGLTLPLVVDGICRRGVGFAPTLGMFYGLNTLGAVGGVILAETVLVLKFGIRGAAFTAALCNVVAFLLAALASGGLGRLRTVPATLRERAPIPVGAFRFLLAAFLMGGALLALEVLWFRFLMQFVVNSSLVLALMLVVVLAGIALGGFIGAGVARLGLPALRSLSILTLGAAAAVVLTYRFFALQFEGLPSFASNSYIWYTRYYDWKTVLQCSLSLMFPSSLLSGALFTLVGKALRAEIQENARAAGLLTMWNTVGAMLGALCSAFVLLPVFGVERSFFAIGLLYFVVAFLVGKRSFWLPFGGPAAVHAAVGLAVAGVLVTFPFGLMRDTFDPLITEKYQQDGSTVVASRESPTETIFYLRSDWLGKPLHYRLLTNGFSMSGTTSASNRYMRLYAYWPAVVSAKPIREALVISYGVGVTASAVRELPAIEHIDVVDTSRDIVEMSSLLYSEQDHPLHDPRVRTHIEDGRQFLLTASRRYDLITGEPPPPRIPGIHNLYSLEYFRLIRERLNEGGVLTYWLPIHDLLEEDVKAILSAFCAAFDNCSLWNGTPGDWMLVGFRGEPVPAKLEDFVAWWQHPVIGPRLVEIGVELPEQLGALFLGDVEYCRLVSYETPPLTDNYPKRLRPLYAPPPDSRARFFSAVVNPLRGQRDFRQSEFIRKLWPEELRSRTDPYFETQQLVNAALSQADPISGIAQLHNLLTTTPLTTLPLWGLGISAGHVRIAEESPTSSDAEYVLALAAMVARNFDEAAAHFKQALDQGASVWATRALYAYTLYMAGDNEAAASLARQLRASRGGLQAQYLDWLQQTFEPLRPSSGGS